MSTPGVSLPLLPADLIGAVSALSSSRDVARVTEIVRTAARRLTNADGAAFILRENDQSVYLDEDAVGPLWKGRRFPMAQCVSGWAMQHRQPVAIRDIALDPRVPQDAYRLTFVRALLIVPVGAGEPVGAIGVYWAREHDATEPETATLTALADAAALAMTNVQLWTDVQRSREAYAAQARELQRRVTEFETLMNVLPIGIGIALDPRGDRIQINRAFGAMLGLAPGANASLSAPDPRPTHFRAFKEGVEVAPEALPLQQAAREGVEIRDLELDIVFDDGRRVRMLEYAAPLFDEEGRARGSVGAFVDVTDRSDAAAQVRASEERFRLLANQAPVMVWVADRAGRCTFLSDTWYAFTGQPRTQCGEDWRAGVHPDDKALAGRALDEASVGPQPFRLEYRLKHRDGGFRWVIEAATPYLHSTGEFAGFIGSVFDITDRKEFEAQRERLLDRERVAREEAERANRLKDEFLASLSHELRTPLNAILGWTQLLRRRGNSPDFLARGLGTLERNAQLQAQLIDDLLDMSRILSGHVRLDVHPVALARVAHAAIESVRPSAEARGLRLGIAVDDGTAAGVLGDPTRLQQVIWNLLTNAIKFTEAGGRVDLTVRRAGEEMEIVVTDTGIGISAEFLPHVFERFRQADASTTRRHGGLGLGLSIVRHLVELHGGTVRAESPGPACGATFVVTLPVASGSRGVHPALSIREGALEGVSLAGRSVLVVDDDEDARALIGLILQQCGADVLTVSSAPAAVEAARATRLDVIVSDIGLPETDGYQLIQQIRSLGGSSEHVPAIALTAFARAEDRRRALDAGFDLHVAKPVEPAQLCDAVAGLLDRENSR